MSEGTRIGRPRKGAPALVFGAGAILLGVGLASSLTFCDGGSDHPGTGDPDASAPATSTIGPVVGPPLVGAIDDPFDVEPAFEPWVQREPPEGYAPLDPAFRTWGDVDNLEAAVPAMCYTRTGGDSNPCYVCHAGPTPMNRWEDWDLQLEYAFSDVALTNHWTNLFEDRSDAVAAISDGAIVAYIRQDNYGPLREELAALVEAGEYHGWVPDVDLHAGFDEEGFAKDGSGWRALRYVPFPGAFWPTNGSTDDVFIRLPAKFRQDRAHYKANLAILEAIVASNPAQDDDEIVHTIEPVDEVAVDYDLDGDGVLETAVTELRGLPDHFLGEASVVETQRWTHPHGTEYLHSVRYVDPARPGRTSTRMKELRYGRKVIFKDTWTITRDMQVELEEKFRGQTPRYVGDRNFGWISLFGWQYQGFIEDTNGWLRLQDDEETRFCMGCHGAIGGTVDGVFTLPRKEPGLEGWREQDLRGLHDRPQANGEDGEILTYFRRVRGADELRGNTEMLQRFFVGDGLRVRENLVRQAGMDGDRDLAWLLGPSWRRALTLNKAYRVIVQRQTFKRGRDATVYPITNVHREIEGNGSTELGTADYVFSDYRIVLDHSPYEGPAGDGDGT